jgi:HAD superfamily hydrolase (TIGR01459 family)
MSSPEYEASVSRFVENLVDLYPRYHMILCDVWGVLHDGVKAYPAALEALIAYRKLGGTVLLLSNAPRPEATVREQIAGFGVVSNAYHAIISSGDMVRAFLEERTKCEPHVRIHHIGPDRDRVLFNGTQARLVSPDEANLCICSGLENDETQESEDYRAVLQTLHARNIPLICANPDRMIERAGRFIACAGAVADLYERMGGAVSWYGKPYLPIYEAALVRLKALKGEAVDPARVLAIGDSLTTDMAGAKAAHLTSMLILGGIHRPHYLTHEKIDMQKARDWLGAQSVTPDYLMASLV